jgi:hypothetical protein
MAKIWIWDVFLDSLVAVDELDEMKYLGIKKEELSYVSNT